MGFSSIHLRFLDVLFWTVQQLIRYQQPIVGERCKRRIQSPQGKISFLIIIFFPCAKFYHYYLFFVQSYIFLPLRSIASTCYALTVCVPAIANPTVLASCISVPAGTAVAAATSVADVTSSGAATSSIGLSSAATSAVGSALPSHDRGGLGFMVLQPPVVPNYPSFTAAFA
jgi:hypothetical protein